MVSELQTIIEECVVVMRELDNKTDEFSKRRLERKYHSLEQRARFLGVTKQQLEHRIQNYTPKVISMATYREGFPALS